MKKKKGKLIIISAPSGAGKNTIIGCIRKIRPEIDLSVSVTTRTPRAGEVNGKSYHFVTREVFNEMIKAGEFLEYAEYIGEYYGTPIGPINESIKNGKNIILEIEVQGARKVMAIDPDAVTIFILPPDMAELERRLRGRGTDTEESLIARLKRAELELDERIHYDYVVVNDDYNRAAEEILSIFDTF